MTNAKHTPGPWSVMNGPDEDYLIGFGNGVWLARVYADGEAPDQVKSDAQIIAAAPEMLEALTDELDAVRDDLRWADGGEMERLMNRRARLETIIAKAEGRS